jgi:hypothetical protein
MSENQIERDDDDHAKIVHLAYNNEGQTRRMVEPVSGTLASRVKFMNTLHDIIARRPSTPRNKVGAPMITDFDKLAASPMEIAEAVLVTLGTIQPVKEVAK